jgi:hypothetical protein
MAGKKPKANSLSADNAKRAKNFVSYFLDQLALGLGQVVPAERLALYIHELSDLSEKQIAFGFAYALRHFKGEWGKPFPYPADLREWCERWRPEAVNDSRRILDRGDKPPDWEPMTAEEARDWIERLRAERSA